MVFREPHSSTQEEAMLSRLKPVQVAPAASWLFSMVTLIGLLIVAQTVRGQQPTPTPPPRSSGGLPAKNPTDGEEVLRGSGGVAAGEEARARARARYQFAKNFRELQELGYRLLREHEAGRLKPAQLAKDAKAIQKRAQSLRSLLILGDDLPPPEVIGSLATPQEFDRSLRRLARLVYSFAHNPVHQNNKVFNMSEAARARADLATLIQLAKAIGGQAKSYAPLSGQANSSGAR
jgi:hypothetical protein